MSQDKLQKFLSQKAITIPLFLLQNIGSLALSIEEFLFLMYLKDKGERFGSYFSLGNFAQNLAGSAANGLVGWFNNFNKGDPVKYNTELWNNWMRETHGLFTNEEFQKLMYIYYITFNKLCKVKRVLFNTKLFLYSYILYYLLFVFL